MLFSEVLAPEEVKSQLRRAVSSGRVSHAQLFYGMEGCHTLGLALAYAQYINCPDRTETDSCGVCPSCVQFQQLAHPDLHCYFPHSAGKDSSSYTYYTEWRSLIQETKGLFSLHDWYQRIGMENKQGMLNKEDMDLLLPQTALKAYEAEYKVFILWMVEKLNPQIAPKLLKTLEEPDGKTLFLLITENHDQVLNTIVSRSQLVKVRRFNTQELAEILQKEKHCEPSAALRIAATVENNLIEALHYENQAEDKLQWFSAFQEMMRYAYALYHPVKVFDFSQALQWVSRMESFGREGQKQFLRYALVMVRKCVMQNIPLERLAPTSPSENEWISKFKVFIREDNISPFYTLLNTAVKQVEANANTKMLFTDLLFSLGKHLKK
ncbi:MAG: hypothetical protein J5873_02280 [Bacteroidales bacterium]|nr:hypothetical protein [Bacteroidales bacterium]